MRNHRGAIGLLAGLVVGLFLFGLVSCEKKTKGGEYVNREEGFSISFPPDWEVRENELGLSVIGFSPLTSANDDFRDNVSVAVSKMEKPLTADELMEANLPDMMKMITDFKPQKRGYLELPDGKAAFLRYTHRQGKFRLTSTLFALPGKTRAYLVYCTAETESAERFGEEFTKIVTSFRVKK